MSERPRSALVARRVVAWCVGWLFAGALYLLLIDNPDLPELLVGAGAATIAATGMELAREQKIVGESIRLSWLARVYRPFLKVPADIAVVALAALRQLFRRERCVGTFRAVHFECGPETQHESGRQAMAEAFGSLAPNTFIVGIDEERELILAHQLRRTGSREALDVLELGEP